MRIEHPKVHEKLVPIENTDTDLKSTVVKLESHLNHYTFHSVDQQIRTNLKFAGLGAKELLRSNKSPSLLSVLFRPLWKFFECYILKLGFLDGKYGLIIALNASYSMFIKYILAHLEKNKCLN